MKNYFKLILCVIVWLVFIFVPNLKADAIALDQIDYYTITVEPQKDGTLNMTYNIEWTVLDSNIEGPLTWVEIGIPNSNVKASKISSNIKKISIPKKVGNYVRIDFKKKYYAGQTVSFSFSLKKVRMYDLDSANNLLSYEFTPGWFNEIEVKNIKVQWKADNVKTHNGKSDGEYITWNSSLKPGGTITTRVTYTASYFDIKKAGSFTSNNNSSNYNNNKNYNNSNNTGGFIISIIFLFIAIAIIFYSWISAPYSYYGHRGYGYYGYWGTPSYHHHHHGGHWRWWRTAVLVAGGSIGGRSVVGGGCACACAGGGRAGCSKKDFYGVQLKSM